MMCTRGTYPGAGVHTRVQPREHFPHVGTEWAQWADWRNGPNGPNDPCAIDRVMTQCLFPFVSGWLSKQDAVNQEAAATTKKPGDANAGEKEEEEEEEEDQEDVAKKEDGEFQDAYGCFALQQRRRRGPNDASRSCQQGVR